MATATMPAQAAAAPAQPALAPCEYKTGKTLGHGSYATVKEAVQVRGGSRRRASRGPARCSDKPAALFRTPGRVFRVAGTYIHYFGRRGRLS